VWSPCDQQPAIHYSNQDVQYTATVYVEKLRDHGVLISLADVSAAWRNDYAERLMRIIKGEAADLSADRELRG